jgi:adenine-specific DNA-methyltransferase
MSKEILQDIITNFEVGKFVRFFRYTNRSFRPQRESLNQYDDESFSRGIKLGEVSFENEAQELIVCAFNSTKSLSESSGKKAQYEKAKKILKELDFDAGIFIFYDQKGKFRFSLIYFNYLGKGRHPSTFRRFTYFVSPDLTNKTFLQRIGVGEGDFSSLKKIKDAFSVEKVTEDFYRDIANWYFWAVQNSRFPKDAEEEENGRNMAVIRLITRLIFVWFMRVRGLVPDSLFNKNKVDECLIDFSSESSSYYKAIL